MTLIAFTLNHKVPFFLGDLLFSSMEGDRNLQLPTNNFAVSDFLPKNMEYRPDSMMQKLYLVKKNVAVALAGDFYEMKEFLKELKQRCNIIEKAKGHVDAEAMHEFIQGYDFNSAFKESGFLLATVDKHEDEKLSFGIFNYPKEIQDANSPLSDSGWAGLHSDVFDDVIAVGTGRNGFLDLVKDITFDTKYTKGDIFFALQSNMTLVARTLAIEKATLHTVQNLWGGGIETLFYDGNSFIKNENVAIVINHGEFTSDGDIGLPIPKLILHYRYIDENLFITAIEIEKITRTDDGNYFHMKSVHGDYALNIFRVPSIDNLSESDPKDLPNDWSFNTDRIAMGYALVTPKNGTFNPAYFNIDPELNINFQQGKDFHFTIRKEINDKLSQSCKKVFPNLK